MNDKYVLTAWEKLDEDMVIGQHKYLVDKILSFT